MDATLEAKDLSSLDGGSLAGSGTKQYDKLMNNFAKLKKKVVIASVKPRERRACNVCSKMISMSNFAKHQKTHSQLNPAKGKKKRKSCINPTIKPFRFICKLCEYGTKRKLDLKRHEKTHSIRNGDKDDFLIRSHLQQLDETTNVSSMQRQPNQFEQPTNTTSVEITHPSVPAVYMTEFVIIDSKIEMLTQVIQIHENASLDAPPEALAIHVKLLEDLAPLFSKVASMFVSLDGNNLADRTMLAAAGDNFLATIMRWTQFTSSLRLQGGIEDAEDRVVFMCHAKITYVPDTNAYLNSLPCVKSIMMEMAVGECYVAIPHQVQRELDGLQHNVSSKVQFNARQALRLLTQYKADVFAQSSSAYFADVTTIKGLPMTDKKIADDLIIMYATTLQTKLKHSVVILTEDKGVYSKYVGMTQSPDEYSGKPSRVLIKRENGREDDN